MCNRAQSSPKIWAMAVGSTTEQICICSGEAWSVSPSRASTPSLGLSCSLLRFLRGPGASQAVRPGGQVIWGATVELDFSEAASLVAREP